MNDDTPQSLKTAAIIQIISGLINFMVMPTIMITMWSFFVSICAMVTFGLGSVLYFCGFFTCLLVPLGIAEMVAGGLTLANPKQGAPIMKVVAMLEMASVLCGGLISCIAGFVVYRMVGDPEVAGYLES